MSENWPLVSVVVTSYRRPDHLKRTMDAFRECCTYPNLEYILCDDGSPKRVQDEMRRLPFDVFVLSQRNQGLGVSANRGMRIARGDYILYMQDDWLCLRKGDFVQDAVLAMNAIPKLGCVRLRVPEPAFRKYETIDTENGLRVRIPVLGQPDSYDGIYVYGQNPHIKPKAFHEKLGYFREDVAKGTGIEDDFCHRFLAQDIFTVGMVEGHEDRFIHIGDDISYFRGKGRWRGNLRHALTRNPVTGFLVKAYGLLPERLRWILRGTPGKAFSRNP